MKQPALISDAPLPGFDRWWAIWPHKVAKVEAQKAWRQLKPSASLEDRLCEALAEQIRVRHRLILQKRWVPDWPHPASWIRGHRWEDELPPVPRMTMASAADVEQIQKSQEVRRLVSEGMSLPEAMRKVGYV